MTSAFYRRLESGLFEPLVPATGSWNRGHQNGVAVGGLLAQAIETTPSRNPMKVTRLTIDIMKPVPFQPVEARVRTIRDGARMQLIDAEIVADGEVVARASAMRARFEETPAGLDAMPDLPLPEASAAIPVTSVLSTGHPMETRVVRGSIREQGPGAFWATFNADLVEGEAMTGLARAAMAADVGSAPSSIVERGAWSFANVDLSLYLTRAPIGDWVLVDAVTLSDGAGVGLVNSVLADRGGVFGRAHQTLFLARIETAA
jgi:hypothetical protein